MSNSWAKVRSFLDLMDIQELQSPLPLSSASSSFSSSASSDLQPLSIGAERWQVSEKTTRQILTVVQPTADSEKRRKEIIEYIQALIEDSFGIKVFPFGSVPLKTYLPHGDVDLTVVSHFDPSQDLAADICNLLQDEEKNNTRIQVRDVLYVPAQVRVVKCTVGNIAVDISFNQTAGLCALCFLEQVDQFIGKDHLFKRSVILIKAWCYYESRLLGGFHGLISTYALETLVLHVINHFHSSLHCPLAVLYKFLEYYSTFNWERYCIGINGLVLIPSLPEIAVEVPHDSDRVLLTEDFLRSSREAFSSYSGVPGTNRPFFPVKFLNILDPLRDGNNLGRSVSKGNFFRIKSALSYGTQKLGSILLLSPGKIREGLENFFVNTLERNGKGKRADVLVPVPEYGAESSEIACADRENDNLLAGIQYGLWFHDYGMIYPLHPSRQAAPQDWNNGWVETGQIAQYDQNMYYDVDETPPSSVDSPTSIQQSDTTSAEEKGKSRGTGPYIPHLEHLIQRNVSLEENRDQGSGKVIERVDSRACTPREENGGGRRCGFNFSEDEFPVLPGSKPISIKVNQSSGSSKYEQANGTPASLDSFEFGSMKCSSLRSLSLSEPGKQSDSDISATLDSFSDPTEDQDSSKSEEKMVVFLQPLELADEKVFPPLGRPTVRREPEIRINKKEFPPLGASLKPEKRSKWKKSYKEAHKGE